METSKSEDRVKFISTRHFVENKAGGKTASRKLSACDKAFELDLITRPGCFIGQITNGGPPLISTAECVIPSREFSTGKQPVTRLHSKLNKTSLVPRDRKPTPFPLPFAPPPSPLEREFLLSSHLRRQLIIPNSPIGEILPPSLGLSPKLFYKLSE